MSEGGGDSSASSRGTADSSTPSEEHFAAGSKGRRGQDSWEAVEPSPSLSG